MSILSQRSWQIARSIWGYRPAAARRMLAALEARCAEEKQRLAGRVEELRSGNRLLRQAAVSAGLDPASTDGTAPPQAIAAADAGTPDLDALGMTILGYDPADLLRVVEHSQSRWSLELGKLRAEVAGFEAERSALLALIGSGLVSPIPAGAGDPVQEMAAALTIPPALTPDRATAGRPPSALRLAVAGPAPPRPATQGGWRPGAIEEEGSRSGQEASRGTAASGGRIQPARAVSQDPPADSPPNPAPVRASLAVPDSQQAGGTQVEAGVRQRLRLLFQRFLAGKILGADLVTADGEVLAARGADITHELVQKAEAAGALPSLIAQMTLPGMAEEQEVRERGTGRPV